MAYHAVETKEKQNMTLFYGQRLNLNQPENGYRPSLDAILLSAAIQKGTTIFDVGCGIGTAGLCLKKRRPEIRLTGIDIQHENIEYAKQNAIQNSIDAAFIHGDIKSLKSPQTFDHVISNPPFYEAHKVKLPQNEHKLLSHVLHNITLKEWVNFCLKHSNEYVTLIHLPEILPELLKLFESLGSLKVFPIWSQGKAERIIIQASKKSKAPLRLLNGLTLQDENGYTKEAEDILKHAQGISL